jgi:hypothetical protein
MSLRTYDREEKGPSAGRALGPTKGFPIKLPDGVLGTRQANR